MGTETSPILTIIIPTYNVEKYIVNSIYSILEQNCDNYKIIIIDDKSTDNTISLIKTEFKRAIKKNTIELIELQRNSGPAKARQIGLDAVNTPYVTFFDADDSYTDLYAISLMIETIKKFQTDFIMFKYITDHGRIKLKKKYKLTSQKILSSRDAMIYKVNKPNPIWHYLWNKCYKTSIIKDHNIRFHTELRKAEDVRFNDDFLVYSHNVVFIDKYLYKYNCCNPSSISHSKGIITLDGIIQQWNFECQNYERLINNCKLLGCDKECKKSLMANLCAFMINITHTYRQQVWSTEIEKLMQQSPYYKDIQEIRPSIERKLQIRRKMQRIKSLIKKIAKA